MAQNIKNSLDMNLTTEPRPKPQIFIQCLENQCDYLHMCFDAELLKNLKIKHFKYLL